MTRLFCVAVALLTLGATARAQEPAAAAGRCATPDTIVFRGAKRTSDATLRSESGLAPGAMNYRTLDRAIKALYALGQFEDVQAVCELSPDGKVAQLVFTLRERPLLGAVDVTGTDRLSRNDVRDRVDLLVGRPLDPAQVARAVQRIDSLYQAEGYYLARVKPETTVVNGDVALDPLQTCTDSTGGPLRGSQSCLVKTYSSPTGMTVNGSIYWAADPFDNGRTAHLVMTDLNLAWNEGKNKANTAGTVVGNELGGQTFLPGIYQNAALGLKVGGVARLDAQQNANAIFIFKVDSSFSDSGILTNRSRIDLVNGAQARNVWFVVGLDATNCVEHHHPLPRGDLVLL